MEISKLKNIAWVVFALVLVSTTVVAQGRRSGNGYYRNGRNYCFNYISDLTETQQDQIVKMEEEHQLAITELRNKNRSTIDAVEKSEIRTKMLKKVETHRNAVKDVLTAEQQKQYDQLHAFGYYGRNRSYRNGRGNFGGRGNGSGYYSRGNRGAGRFCRTGYGRGAGN